MTSTTIANRIIVEESFHSKAGASSSHRWLNCTGSINLTQKLIEAGVLKPRTSRAAAEGTAAHLVLSTCLEDGSEAQEMANLEIEVQGWVFIVDQEMVHGVQETLDWVRARIAKAISDGFETKLYIEQGLSSILDDDAYGTADVIIHIIGDRLIIGDFKYGKGVSVEPDSDQLTYYGYLGIENFIEDPESISVVENWIFQPRIPHPDGTIRRHVTNCEDLTSWWFDDVLPAIRETRDPDAPLTVGEHCHSTFCPNKENCPALKQVAFELPVDIDPSHLTDHELGEVITKIKAIKALEDGLKAEALKRARAGGKITGYKLVRKSAKRKFRDSLLVPDPKNADEMISVSLEAAAFETFGDDAFEERKYKSPKQLENLDGGEEFVQKWAFSPDNGLTIAANSDKKREVKPILEQARRPVVNSL